MISGERGGAAITTVVGALAVGAVAILLVAAATSVGHAAARARTAADAAALAGAAASPLLGGDGTHCGEAARVARANGAVLRDCVRAPPPGAASTPGTVVTVTVAVAVAAPLSRQPPAVRARAAAMIRPSRPGR